MKSIKDKTIARRYSRALFELAVDSGELKETISAMRELYFAAEKIPMFIKEASDERVEETKRVGAVREIARVLGLTELCTNFLELLIIKKRFTILPLIAEDVIGRIERCEKIVKAEAKVADAALAAELKKRIEEILGKITSFNIECAVEEDKDLLGGFLVKIGDTSFNASVKEKLGRIQEELLK